MEHSAIKEEKPLGNNQFPPSKELISEWKEALESLSPPEVMAWAQEKFGNQLTLASSLGVEDQVLTHFAAGLKQELELFLLDTGRLFQQTYELIEKTEQKYQLRIKPYFPEASEVEAMVKEDGINLFYKSAELRKKCCGVRKITPLKRALSGKQAWIVGLRRGQSVTRESTPVIEWDEGNSMIKLSPLWNWSSEQVWDFVKKHDIPYNPLHDEGFLSIGCASCTRAVQPGEDERAGRWWWEKPEQKECGLHIVDGKLVRGS